jgi:aspartate-semialdehyde dehydrogenase
MFISNDNLRKGAALNAVQIAELLAGRLVSSEPPTAAQLAGGRSR